MRILNLRHTSAAGSVLARFDIEVSSEITLLDWYLKRTGRGELRVFPPSPRHGQPSARLSPKLMAEVSALVISSTEGDARYDVLHAA